MKYTIKKIIDKAYVIQCDHRYDLCMLFLRYQEYYESPNPEFRGKAFELLDYMEWYSKDKDGFFSYPIDWNGFNLSSKVIDEVSELGIPDYNKYDEEMEHIHGKLKQEVGGDYYLIGIFSDPDNQADIDETLNHELAHALYYLFPEYKKEMDELINNLPSLMIALFNDWLGYLGYTQSVFVDEMQAYISTGFEADLANEYLCYTEPFEKVFEKYKESSK